MANVIKVPGPLETLLLTEGPDDLNVIQALLDIYGYDGKIRMQSGEGYVQLRKELKAILNDSQWQRLGIIVDADTDPKSRWLSIRDRLKECGCDPPKELTSEGAIFPGSRGIVGVWVMPDNDQVGALEAFLRLLVPMDDPNWEYAGTCVSGVPKPGGTSANWGAKAQLHTWLAWQKYPGKAPEQTFKPRYLDPKAQAAQNLIGWLERLFEL